MPATNDIASRVRKIVIDHLGVTSESVADDASFASLGADSLDQVELVMLFEEEFDIEIADEDMNTIVTVGDAVKQVELAVKALG